MSIFDYYDNNNYLFTLIPIELCGIIYLITVINFSNLRHNSCFERSIAVSTIVTDEDSDGEYASIEGASSSAIQAIFRSIEVCT